jgi:hypothetical protein
MNSKSYSVIRDPVHGDLYLSAEEMQLLDTAEMQRLRGVRQLGTAHLVYPGAQHTRFEHSLGTLHMTSRLVEAVNLNRSLAPRELLGIAEEESRILRAAALVHDITHIPFGHNIEDQSGILPRHDSAERYAEMLGEASEVGQVLERMGIRTEVLATLLAPGQADLPEVPPYWRELLSDTICADILDYLKRDAYFTGLNLLYDERVVNYFKIDRASGHLFVDVAKRGLVRADILSEILRVLEARYFFSERVYYHHAKIAAGAMIAQAVEGALLRGGLQPEELYRQTDDSLVLQLKNHPPSDGREQRRHLELLRRFQSRRLLKRACVFPRYANREVQADLVQRFFAPGQHQERTQFEAAVEAEIAGSGNPGPLVVLYCPARHMQLKEAATHVRFPDRPGVHPLSERADDHGRLDDLASSYQDLWKLYVLAATDQPEELRKVAGAVQKLLPEATNVYQPS